MTHVNVALGLSYMKLLLSSWKTYAQFEGIVFQQIVGFPMATNCAPLITDLFYVVMRGTFCLTFTNLSGMTL